MIKQKKLGNTDISVSILGLGTVKFGRNTQVAYPQPFELPSDKAIVELLARARDLGINLIDTAPAYGFSEERLGGLLKKQRHDWVISTKVGEEFSDQGSYFDFSALSVKRSIERSLQRLKTDYVDIVLVHSNGEDEKIINENPVFQTLEALKIAGLIRAFGMSTKTVAGGLLAVERSDVVMVTHNPTYQAEQEVIAYAHQKNKGVFIKKALVSGHLQKITGIDPVLAAMQCVFQEPGVSSVIVGTINPLHLQHNVQCVEQV
jgi:aryl-alcohol dehydrogenase-like predicted oxidoreductase